MNFSSSNPLANIPTVVKNLLIINVLMLFGTWAAGSSGIDLGDTLGLHHWKSDLFRPHQLVTYMFMHGGFQHLFFNMFALWMFGKILEQVWGSKRFLIYYMVTGIGAGIIQLIVIELRILSLKSQVDPEFYQIVLNEGLSALQMGKNFTDPIAGELNHLINTTTVGASGAVFGILLAFGMLFPNTQLMLLIPPIPIKAKYFVALYGLFELYMGFSNNPADNVAHFAHLGGMLFGFILIKMWKKNTNTFY
ncbi:MAG: rhomboid family intramembrane serine protease [Bacteroidetes bacterium]|nr:MAG: rhomboid family intramembrane serine protease [Bacteroidota bacterium]MBL1145324.1 rhomboid family intramembrane serine protease [Bacteroidota bacterium]NOG58121.1 rhomboid family intramembrane serine protease [Bacteroidota bacterium]